MFLDRPDDVVAATFTTADLPELEASLSDAIHAIHHGRFRPTPSVFACEGCPVLGRICAGPELLESWPSDEQPGISATPAPA